MDIEKVKVIGLQDTVDALFRQIVERYPKEPAIIEEERVLDFEKLKRMADSIAASFPEGTKSVGIVMRHRAEMIASILAVLSVGARYIPAEPDFPTGRIREMMSEAQVDFILTEPDLIEKLEGFPLLFADEALKKGQRIKAAKEIDPESPAYVLYTSGTTGHPKGVCVRNRNVCHYVRAFANEFHPKPGDIMLQYSVCSFDIFVEEVFASLLNGAALAIPPQEAKEDLDALMDFAERHRLTIISGFPYLLSDMNRLQSIPSSLRLLISGGDVLRGSYVDRLIDQALVYNTYGPSETTVCASYYRCNGGTVLADGTYPVGKPVKGCEIRVLDEKLREVPAGMQGEICILGGGVSLGYIGDHKEENRAFVQLPDKEVLYRSGDLGYWLEDGNLAFLHRMDEQIMIYGRRVEIAEVESRLCGCRNVRQAYVRAMSDEDGLSYMAAYIVPEKEEIKPDEIREELGQYLPSFMIPECFVEIDKIPINANGKPDVSALPDVRRGECLIGNRDKKSGT